MKTMHRTRSARVISLASGKGGVGKTNIAVNLSLALSRLRRRSMVVDCDMGLANAALMMGLKANETIDDVVSGSLSLDEIVVDGPEAVFVIPGSTGGDGATSLDPAARRRLAAAFRPHARSLDYVIVDTATGNAPDTLDLVADADMVLLVISPEPTAFMDAYATAKRLTLEQGVREIAIVANMVDNEAAGRDLFRRFSDVAARFLTTEFRFIALGRLARTIDFLDLTPGDGGARFFGMEALLGVH
jgi:flagellar biosynthesis protein FlhG